MFGQGAKGVHFRALENQYDSVTAQRLYKRKDITSALLRRLEFPAAEHHLATSVAAARDIARRLGFPLVVKPVDGDLGIGVVVGIDSMEELDRACAHARAALPDSPILVERFVPGDHHRITIFNGRLLAASRIVPASIVGDGARTVGELIGAENVKRRDNPQMAAFWQVSP